MGLEHPIPQPPQDCVSLCQAPRTTLASPSSPPPSKKDCRPWRKFSIRSTRRVASSARAGRGRLGQEMGLVPPPHKYPRRPAGKRQHCRLRGPGPSAGQARGRSGALGWVAEAEEGTLRWPSEPPSGRSWRGGFWQGQGASHNRPLRRRPTKHSSKPCRTDWAKLRAQAMDSWRSGDLCRFCF